MGEGLSRGHKMLLQLYVGIVLIAAVGLGNEWLILLAGALLLPVVVEFPSFGRRSDNRPRPDGWTRADEIVLRARETWARLLRVAFWVAWELGWIAADRIGAEFPAEDRIIVRALSITASMILLVAAAYLTRRQMSARAIRRAEAAVKAEGKYPA